MVNKSNTQREQENYTYECPCGSHLIRIVRGEYWRGSLDNHSIEFWEHRGNSYRTLWQRIMLGFNIIFGKEGKYPIYDILVRNEDVEALGNAILSLKVDENDQKMSEQQLALEQ